jgi:hypothetical protein
VRHDALRQLQRFADDVFLARDVLGAGEERRPPEQRLANLRGQRLRLREVAERDPEAADAVDVGRADPAAGGADRGAAAVLLGQLVERRMVRKDDMRALGDGDPGDINAELLELVELVDEPAQRKDRPGADQQLRRLDQHARRHDVQRQLRLADFDRMTGVVPAPEAGDDVIISREQVDDAALRLIAPLDADANVYGRAGLAAAPPREHGGSFPLSLRGSPGRSSIRRGAAGRLRTRSSRTR